MSERGRVRWYSPEQGKGTLASEYGQEFRFVQVDDSLMLQGGDVVEFEPGSDASRSNAGEARGRDASVRYAHDIRVVRRCVDDLLIHDAKLAQQFHETVAICAPQVSGSGAEACATSAYDRRTGQG